MLKYLYSVTENLLITVTLVTLMYALMARLFGRKGRLFQWIGIGAGVFLSAAVTVIRNDIGWNRWLNTWMNVNQQDVRTIYAILLSSLLLIVLALFFARREGKRFGIGECLTCVAGAFVTASLIFYVVPGVMSGPLTFDTMGNGVISQEYGMRLLGWLLALVLMIVYSRFLYRCALKIKGTRLLLTVLLLGLAVCGFRYFGLMLRFWTAGAKWLHWPVKYKKADYPWAFPLVSFASGNILLFSLVVSGLAMLVPAALFAQNLRVTEPYDNPAQHRKLRANGRRLRRLAVKVGVCFAAAVVCLTVVKGIATKKVELSPPETYTVADGNIYVPLEQVNDGHLHRFEYTTDNRIAVRWIVVRKPGSASYGVGLDACDVCGNAGYYERSGQIVCKRCDVVMNINTIGFKGGCNPIPLSYSVADGQMVFSLADIVAGEKEFK